MRTSDTEHNWFWQEGYRDGHEGRPMIAPDEVRHQHQRSDYFIGFDAGALERVEKAAAEADDALELESLAATAVDAPPIDLERAKTLVAIAMGQVQAMIMRQVFGSHQLDETLRELFTVLDK